jgi:hypothetical protein
MSQEFSAPICAPADATAADAKEVRVGEMPTASALAGRNMTERCGLPPSTRCTYEGARQVCWDQLERRYLCLSVLLRSRWCP